MEVEILKYAHFSKVRKGARNCIFGWKEVGREWGRVEGGKGVVFDNLRMCSLSLPIRERTKLCL